MVLFQLEWYINKMCEKVAGDAYLNMGHSKQYGAEIFHAPSEAYRDAYTDTHQISPTAYLFMSLYFYSLSF